MELIKYANLVVSGMAILACVILNRKLQRVEKKNDREYKRMCAKLINNRRNENSNQNRTNQQNIRLQRSQSGNDRISIFRAMQQ